MAFEYLGDGKKMKAAIKEVIVPELRKHGFKGSYPHFRREKKSYHELLTFYITRYNVNFYIETGIIPLEGYINSEDDLILPQKVTVLHLKASERFVVGSDITGRSDGIPFVFKDFNKKEEYEELAKEALLYLKINEDEWIKNRSEWQKKEYEKY